MKASRISPTMLVAVLALAVLASCGQAPAANAPAANAPAAGGAKTYKDMTLCYPQLGAESDWRTANTASIKETATTLGVKQLVFSDAQQKQENQISAMRACIQQGVDVIALPPVVEDGWDAVLNEAKNANIPVIVVDRSVSADKSLYAAHIGSDMALEGERAAAEFNKLLPNGGAILELSGTTGSGAAVGRAKGLRNKLNPNIKIIDSQTGNFTRAEALPVTQAFLNKYKPGAEDRKSTRLNSSHLGISYAVFCLKKKKKTKYSEQQTKKKEHYQNQALEHTQGELITSGQTIYDDVTSQEYVSEVTAHSQ